MKRKKPKTKNKKKPYVPCQMVQPKKLRPRHWTCGGGSDINCMDYDDVNGCWRNCRYVGDDGCYIYEMEEEDEIL